MMNEFEKFDLSEWADEGIVFQVAHVRKRKAKSRKTPWPAVFIFASVLLTGVTHEAVTLPSDGASTGVVASTAVPWKPTADVVKDKGDLVTPEFWREVQTYVSNLKPVPVEADLAYPDPIV